MLRSDKQEIRSTLPQNHQELACLPSRTDVFIAGGGPAGLACAIALASKGLSVHLVDGMKPPIDKACGEGLMPDTLAALDRLGIDLAAPKSGLYAGIRGIRFLDTGSNASAQAPFPSREGRGMKRKHLHQLLLDRAIELGVRLTWETVVRDVTEQGTAGCKVETNRGVFTARFVVGADGQQSRIRAWAGLDHSSTSTHRVGLRQHFAIVPWSDSVEVYWSGHGQAYVTPVSSTEICVAFVSKRKFAEGVPEALLHFPQLCAYLAGASPSDTPRGSITCSRKLHRVTRGNIALLGDASGSVDAVTGEGLSLAFRQALALADAIQADDLAAYQRAHTAIRRLPHVMASSMLLLDRSPFLRLISIALLERCPRVFARLLQLHIGHVPAPLRAAAGQRGHAPGSAAARRHEAMLYPEGGLLDGDLPF